MPNILVRNVPQSVIDALKKRAKENRRSLQQEVLTVLETICVERDTRSPAQVAAAIRSRLEREGRYFGDSAEMIREDRQR